MVFSLEKFQFANRTVEFAGFQITMKGIQPTDKYITAIKNFPTPTNISTVRSWFGLINQVAYSFMKTENEKIVELIKEGVAAFNMNMVTCLQTTARKGWAGSYNRRSANALILSQHAVKRAGDWC